MAPVDSTTWQALGLTLTLLGLVATVLVWRRRGAASGLRTAAWALLPLAAAMTGVLRLGWRIADAVLDWGIRLVFSPVVWGGIALAGVSAVLFGMSALLRRRRTPAVPVPVTRGPARGSRAALPAVGEDDMGDIEAILRKHGIQ